MKASSAGWPTPPEEAGKFLRDVRRHVDLSKAGGWLRPRGRRTGSDATLTQR